MVLGTRPGTSCAFVPVLASDANGAGAEVGVALVAGAGAGEGVVARLLLELLGVCLLALACRLINCASVINVMISQCKRIFHVIQFVAASSGCSYNNNTDSSNGNNNNNGNDSQSICIAFLLNARHKIQKT